MINTCIYLDYNFLLLWYFLILEVNNKKGYFIINFNKIASVLTVVNIQDENLVVLALEVGHRKNIYNS